MQILNGVSATPTTTNTNTLVAGAILNATNALSISFTVKNSGDTNSLDYEVIGGNAPDLSDGVVVQASATLAFGAVGSYGIQVAPFAYYGVKVKSTSAGNHSQASVLGKAKG